jgi:hypothetical protein
VKALFSFIRQEYLGCVRLYQANAAATAPSVIIFKVLLIGAGAYMGLML